VQQGWSHEVSVGQERCGAGAAELSDCGVSAPIAISRSYKDDETSPINLQCVSGTNQAGLEAGAGMATRAATLRWCQFVVYTRCIQCSRGQGADGAVPALVLGCAAHRGLRYRLQRSLGEGIIIERAPCLQVNTLSRHNETDSTLCTWLTRGAYNRHTFSRSWFNHEFTTAAAKGATSSPRDRPAGPVGRCRRRCRLSGGWRRHSG